MSPLIIPIAIEWVILVTTAAPMLLTGRFNKSPKLGLAIWFAAFLSSGIATLVAVFVAVASIFETYVKLSAAPLGSAGWLQTLGISFAPWAILAISGIALALINQRIEPLISSARDTAPMLDAALRPWMNFNGYRVMQIELPVIVAAVAKGRILVSTAASRTLRESELHAVLWHEIGHLRGRRALRLRQPLGRGRHPPARADQPVRQPGSSSDVLRRRRGGARAGAAAPWRRAALPWRRTAVPTMMARREAAPVGHQRLPAEDRWHPVVVKGMVATTSARFICSSH